MKFKVRKSTILVPSLVYYLVLRPFLALIKYYFVLIVEMTNFIFHANHSMNWNIVSITLSNLFNFRVRKYKNDENRKGLKNSIQIMLIFQIINFTLKFNYFIKILILHRFIIFYPVFFNYNRLFTRQLIAFKFYK